MLKHHFDIFLHFHLSRSLILFTYSSLFVLTFLLLFNLPHFRIKVSKISSADRSFAEGVQCNMATLSQRPWRKLGLKGITTITVSYSIGLWMWSNGTCCHLEQKWRISMIMMMTLVTLYTFTLGDVYIHSSGLELGGQSRNVGGHYPPLLTSRSGLVNP